MCRLCDLSSRYFSAVWGAHAPSHVSFGALAETIFLGSKILYAFTDSFLGFTFSLMPQWKYRCVRIVTVIALLASCGAVNSAEEEKYDANRDLIVFVGKKLSVTAQPVEEDSLDGKFEARFRVLRRVFGRYDKTEITFTAFDHYGKPAFAHYETVLLFIARYKGKLYHEKYQFFPVYPTANGRWASCGSPDQWEGSYYHGRLKPVPIEFAGNVVNEATGRTCTEGNYAEELVQLKKNGVLKSRGWVF